VPEALETAKTAAGQFRPCRETDMAKGQKKSNKEARKPKAEKKKTIAANPSREGVVRGLENFKS
jgi:hypothetical protein